MVGVGVSVYNGNVKKGKLFHFSELRLFCKKRITTCTFGVTIGSPHLCSLLPVQSGSGISPHCPPLSLALLSSQFSAHWPLPLTFPWVCSAEGHQEPTGVLLSSHLMALEHLTLLTTPLFLKCSLVGGPASALRFSSCSFSQSFSSCSWFSLCRFQEPGASAGSAHGWLSVRFFLHTHL